MNFAKMYDEVSFIKQLPCNGKIKSFSLEHKAVYSYLLSWKEQAGSVFPSQQRIADDLGTPKRSIIRYLDALEDFGIIVRTRRYDSSTMYDVKHAHEVVAMAKHDNGKASFYIAPLPSSFMRIIDSVLCILERIVKSKTEPDTNTQQDASGEGKQKKLTLPTPYKSDSVRDLPVEPVVSYPWDDEGTDWGDYMHCPTTGRWVHRSEAIPFDESW